jgi:hypothetical protein
VPPTNLGIKHRAVPAVNGAPVGPPKPELAREERPMPTTPRPGFEEAYRQLLASFPAPLTVEEKERIREDLRLQYNYPGEYVVCLDTWEGDGPDRRLVRQVVDHKPCLDDLDSTLTEHRDQDVSLRYADAPFDTSIEIVPEEAF